MNPLLELVNVCYAYHSKSGETPALSDISFQVQQGEFIAVVGPSGCGKSTLLSLISGLLVPESGSILFAPGQKEEQGPTDTIRTDGSGAGKTAGKRHGLRHSGKGTDVRNGNGAALREETGYMLQKDHLFEWRSIYRNVILGLEIQHRLNEETMERVDKMLRDYGLYRFRNARPSELSGGMRQRAALIRTLALNPQLLLLDEPFSALDFQTRLKVCDDVADILHKEKKTALLVTHDLSEAVSMADRIIVLTRRPAKVQRIFTLKFGNGLTPFERRDAPEFKEYFNLLWKELNENETEPVD